MKPHLFLVALTSLLPATLSPAQDAPPAPTPAPELAVEARSPEQLDQLSGPIALYPDALIALILPASTEPSDIVLAARFLNAKGDPSLIDTQPWDESVRSLARYPDVIKWLDENLAWTKQMGAAFLEQPADVMKSIQRLRVRARAAGTLKSTPQQEVVVDEDEIRIVPAQQDVIYVPRYDPAVVYVERRTYYPDPFITFGLAYPIGSWLSYDCDWRHRRIWVADRRDRDWHHRRDWRRPVFPDRPGYVARPGSPHWRPLPQRPHVGRPGYRPQPNRPGDVGSSRPGWNRDHDNHNPTPPAIGTAPRRYDYRHGVVPTRPAPGQVVAPEARPRLNAGQRPADGRNWNPSNRGERTREPAPFVGPTVPNAVRSTAPVIPSIPQASDPARRLRHGGGEAPGRSFTPPPAARQVERPAPSFQPPPARYSPPPPTVTAPAPVAPPAPAAQNGGDRGSRGAAATYRHGAPR